MEQQNNQIEKMIQIYNFMKKLNDKSKKITSDLVKYKEGKIYALRSHNTDKFYIGSTIQTLENRFVSHMKGFKYSQDEHVTSYKIIELGDCYIELLDNFPCENKKQLEKQEGIYIRKYSTEVVNKRIAGRSRSEHYREKKEALSVRRSVVIQCECGANIQKMELSRHKRSIKHINFIKSN